MATAAVQINGSDAIIRFNSFGLDNYPLFLKCKKLPESTCEYDWRTDTYTITTPARFASILGAELPTRPVATLPLAEYLWDYERFIVQRALEAKRYAIFANCGLGKTPMALEFARQVMHLVQSGKVLIFTLIDIFDEFFGQCEQFYGDSLPIVKLETRDELIQWLKPNKGEEHDNRERNQPDGSNGDNGAATGDQGTAQRTPEPCTRGRLAICNYEKLIPGQMPELRYLAGLILDESSILKSGGGKIKWNLIKSAKGIEYKLSCTATPAPNDVMEYASQAAFLEKLRSEGEILWTFFSKKGKNGTWEVKPHAKEAFYKFMSSWSIYLRNPASYGFKDNIRPVPKPDFIEHRISMTETQKALSQALFVKTGAGMFGEKSMGIRERSKLSQIAKGFIYGKAL